MSMSNSPITQVSESPITQVSQQYSSGPPSPGQGGFPSKLLLDLRGTRFEIDRDVLVSLPESILIVMFPNGLILGRGHSDNYDDDDNNSEESLSLDDQIIYVDFDPACMDYVLDFYHEAQMAGETQRLANNPSSSSSSAASVASQQAAHNLGAQNPLLNKQAIIVLREELDYFAVIPPKSGFPAKDDMPATGPVMADVTKVKAKTQCGTHLLEQRKIFTALQRNINKENNVAEQHLIDMLCVSGFSRDDEWGYRDIEPKKTSIVSIALVMLKTTGSGNQMATAQKLLLFWRKPARKCWWDGVEIELDQDDHKLPIRLWARRTWTLELVLV
ncbi:hypothetical protein BG011_002739 [Mortierella polycephala]|uniref:Phosphatase activator n=1 Tax=Mortierella polycephala TaxID=41804 RepID=A0A9P6Q5A1_9FUNG|nr:hypothetical protein BG011_002739 [Mortierella polycephala]